MTEFLMAVLAIALGVFMILVGCLICTELPILHGAELLFTGFIALLCVLSGLMCITVVVEH